MLSIQASTHSFTNLHQNNTELRVWVSEPLRKAMDEVSDSLGMTLSKYLREFFVVYLYGKHELLCMIENKTGIYFESPKEQSPANDSGQIRFSRSPSAECIPGLGKNIIPLKIFLNEKIKSDLQGLATKANLPLSQFVREILTSHFLGHVVWAEREQLFSSEQEKRASAWESGNIDSQSVHPSDIQASDGKVENIDL